MVPLPGRAIPMASARQFILLAVNIPEQLPQVGHAACSISRSSSAVIWPDWRLAPATKASIKSTVLPDAVTPASIGPPETKIVGMLVRMAPMNIPGTILSQFGMQTMPSNRWASIMVSTLSAMISREGRENFIPLWPMAIPSSTPMVLKMNGTPPASRTHSFT